MSSYYLAIDFGTRKTKLLVGSREKENWQILLSHSYDSRGIKQGEIREVNAVAEDLDKALNEIGGVLKKGEFKKVIVGINSPTLDTHPTKGVIVISRPNQEITEEDKERADKGAQAFPLPPNREPVQFVSTAYIIDGNNRVKDPIGIKGLRLESEALLIDVFSPVIRNLNQVGRLLKMEFSYQVVSPLAGAEIVLTEEDKELGAVALDLGAGTTGYSVYRDGQLIDMKTFPLGGNDITNDVAIVLKIPVRVAEQIKVQEGKAWAKKVAKGESFDLSQYWEEAEESKKISKKLLAEIIEARLSEILELIGTRLKEIGLFSKLPGGVVLYGGGAKMPLVKELVREKLKLPVRIAAPDIGWYRDNNDLSFIPVLGLLQNAVILEDTSEGAFVPLNAITNFFKKLFSW